MILACGFFIAGNLLGKFLGVPGPIVMIFSAALFKVAALLPEQMETGAYLIYRFIAINLTWPLLVGLGATLVRWQDLVAAITAAHIAICARGSNSANALLPGMNHLNQSRPLG